MGNIEGGQNAMLKATYYLDFNCHDHVWVMYDNII